LAIREWSLRYFLKAGNALWLHESGESPVLGQKDALFALPPFRDVWESSLALDRARWKELGRAMEGEHEPELSRSLMANAKRYFGNGEYRAAVVDAVTALEVGLSLLIRRRCKEKGISHTKFEEVSHDLGVAMQLKLLLPLVVTDQELETWRLTRRRRLADSLVPLSPEPQDFEGAASIRACVELNRIRNNIVHKGWIPREEKDFKEIRRGIRGADWLVDFTAGAVM
jgi:HEPN domain-containing protein